jgi:Flp pilus assembly protein TadG
VNWILSNPKLRHRNGQEVEVISMGMRIGTLGRKLRQFVRCRDGAAALEFALVLPPLCLILVGMFEVSMLMFTQASMEGALREAARFGMTGSVEDPEDREAQIMDIIDKHTYGVVDMSTANITFEVYDGFGDVDDGEPYVDTNANGNYDVGEPFTNQPGCPSTNWDADCGQAGVGSSAEVVQYTVSYDWEVMTPFMAQFMGDEGKIKMKASVVIRNEPWLEDPSES